MLAQVDILKMEPLDDCLFGAANIESEWPLDLEYTMTFFLNFQNVVTKISNVKWGDRAPECYFSLKDFTADSFTLFYKNCSHPSKPDETLNNYLVQLQFNASEMEDEYVFKAKISATSRLT